MADGQTGEASLGSGALQNPAVYLDKVSLDSDSPSWRNMLLRLDLIILRQEGDPDIRYTSQTYPTDLEGPDNGSSSGAHVQVQILGTSMNSPNQ